MILCSSVMLALVIIPDITKFQARHDTVMKDLGGELKWIKRVEERIEADKQKQIPILQDVIDRAKSMYDTSYLIYAMEEK
jgi:hypothetical protein